MTLLCCEKASCRQKSYSWKHTAGFHFHVSRPSYPTPPHPNRLFFLIPGCTDHSSILLSECIFTCQSRIAVAIAPKSGRLQRHAGSLTTNFQHTYTPLSTMSQ